MASAIWFFLPTEPTQTMAANLALNSDPQPFHSAPSDETVLDAYQEMKVKMPQCGRKKLLALIKADNPQWGIGVKVCGMSMTGDVNQPTNV